MMPLDEIRSPLLMALSWTPPLRRLDMHTVLIRLALTKVGAIRRAWQEPEWQRWASILERDFDLLLEQADWAERLAEQAGKIEPDEEERLLIFLAALLRALDRYHSCHPTLVAGAVVALPRELGGIEAQFLPPPKSPIADWIPESRRLLRGPGDLRNNLRTILQLYWHVVSLDQRPVRVQLGNFPETVSLLLDKRLKTTGDLRVGLATPFADLSYQGVGDIARCGSEGTPYRFTQIKPDSLGPARDELAEILRLCGEQRVDILCFPELTLDPDLLHSLRLFLKTRNPTRHPGLVMAGSFHTDSDQGWVNRCRILDGRGNVLFSQDKCVWYRLPAEQVTPELCVVLGIDERGGREDITPSSFLQILDGPLGRLATPICLDFCGDELWNLFVESGVNLLLVPAMTPQMEPFRVRARDLGTQNRAITFVVNSAWLLRRLGIPIEDTRHLLLAYLPGKRLETAGRKLSNTLYLCSIRELVDLP